VCEHPSEYPHEHPHEHPIGAQGAYRGDDRNKDNQGTSLPAGRRARPPHAHACARVCAVFLFAAAHRRARQERVGRARAPKPALPAESAAASAASLPVVRMSYACRTRVVRMSYACRTHVVRMSYACRTHVVRMSYACRTRVVRMSYACRMHVVRMSYAFRMAGGALVGFRARRVRPLDRLVSKPPLPPPPPTRVHTTSRHGKAHTAAPCGGPPHGVPHAAAWAPCGGA
jgi:hypothetical protein